jgi:hypothetical protein
MWPVATARRGGENASGQNDLLSEATWQRFPDSRYFEVLNPAACEQRRSKPSKNRNLTSPSAVLLADVLPGKATNPFATVEYLQGIATAKSED